MNNIQFSIEPDNGENAKIFGSLDSAVEYTNNRPSENFTVRIIYNDQSKELVKEVADRLYNVLRSNCRIVY